MEGRDRNDRGHDPDSWINVGNEMQNSGNENDTEAAVVAESEEDNSDDEDSEDEIIQPPPVSTYSMFARGNVTSERKAKSLSILNSIKAIRTAISNRMSYNG